MAWTQVATRRGRAAHTPLWVLGGVLVLLFVAVQLLLVDSYRQTERTTSEFKRTTDTLTAIANVQRETLLLSSLVARLQPGDGTDEIELRRGLIDRQIAVALSAGPDQRGLKSRVAEIRRDLASFDAALSEHQGGDAVRDALARLEVEVKETYDNEEHALYAALHQTLHERAQSQLLIAGVGAFALLMAACLGLLLRRAIRGDFARAYRMLDHSEERFRRLVEQLPAIVYQLELPEEGLPVAPSYVSPQARDMLGLETEPDAPPTLATLASHLPREDRREVAAALSQLAAGVMPPPVEFRYRRRDGQEIWLRGTGAAITAATGERQLQGLVFDVTAAKRAQAERERIELELRLAQKLEAVGQLAAGIAHEINTPIQFVGNTVSFIERSVQDLLELQAVHDEIERAAAAGPVPADLLARVAETREAVDLDYLRERLPLAFARSGEGIGRVGTIVAAMREFAHPSETAQAPADINHTLQNTLVVAANEYKYVADVETDLAELPPVVCNAGDLGQVFLNLIVNAAHAIGDGVGDSGERGRLGVRTRVENDEVVISIQDTGGGIPDTVAERVFDPFFTTKEVGRGTGQGLAIARTLVVERHGGTLTFDTSDSGTTFHVAIPIAGCHPPADIVEAAA